MQRMAVLRDNNAKLEVAVKAKDSTIKALKENMEKQIKLTKDLNNKLTIAEENNKKISKILAETDIVEKVISPTIAIAQKPKAVKMLETKIIVITEKNLPEVIKKVKAGMGEFVIYGLDPASFKNLALNFEEIKRYIEQQKEIIIYYEEAVKPKDKK